MVRECRTVALPAILLLCSCGPRISGRRVENRTFPDGEVLTNESHVETQWLCLRGCEPQRPSILTIQLSPRQPPEEVARLRPLVSSGCCLMESVKPIHLDRLGHSRRLSLGIICSPSGTEIRPTGGTGALGTLGRIWKRSISRETFRALSLLSVKMFLLPAGIIPIGRSRSIFPFPLPVSRKRRPKPAGLPYWCTPLQCALVGSSISSERFAKIPLFDIGRFHPI